MNLKSAWSRLSFFSIAIAGSGLAKRLKQSIVDHKPIVSVTCWACRRLVAFTPTFAASL
jgi:hypothetical protein